MINITNIIIKNGNIIITYYDNKTKTIPYNLNNRTTLINNLKEYRNIIEQEYKAIIKYYKISILISIINTFLLILNYLYSNNIIFNFLISITIFEIIFTCLLFNKFLKEEKNNLKNILNIIENDNFPNENIFINDKTIDFLEYKKIFNKPIDDGNNLNNDYGKIIEFKK